MSVKYCLPVPVFYFCRKLLTHPVTLQRGLSAIAEHLGFDLCLCIVFCAFNAFFLVIVYGCQYHYSPSSMAYYGAQIGNGLIAITRPRIVRFC